MVASHDAAALRRWSRAYVHPTSSDAGTHLLGLEAKDPGRPSHSVNPVVLKRRGGCRLIVSGGALGSGDEKIEPPEIKVAILSPTIRPVGHGKHRRC